MLSQWPYSKKSKVADSNDLDEMDRQFHDTNKPRWAPDGTLVHTVSGSVPRMEDGFIVNVKGSAVSEHSDTRLAKFVTPVNVGIFNGCDNDDQLNLRTGHFRHAQKANGAH